MEAEIEYVIKRHTLNTAYDAAWDAYGEMDSLHIGMIKLFAAMLPLVLGIMLCVLCGFRMSMIALKPVQPIILASVPILSVATIMSLAVIIYA